MINALAGAVTAVALILCLAAAQRRNWLASSPVLLPLARLTLATGVGLAAVAIHTRDGALALTLEADFIALYYTFKIRGDLLNARLTRHASHLRRQHRHHRDSHTDPPPNLNH